MIKGFWKASNGYLWIVIVFIKDLKKSKGLLSKEGKRNVELETQATQLDGFHYGLLVSNCTTGERETPDMEHANCLLAL